MKLTVIFSIGAVQLAGVNAWWANKCITNSEAISYAHTLGDAIGAQPGWQAQVMQYFRSDVKFICDSDEFVTQVPLNTTFHNDRASFIANQSPSLGPATDLFIGHSCNVVTHYFYLLPDGKNPIRAMAILFVDERKTRQVYQVYFEYNSAAALRLFGNPQCQGNFTYSVGNQGPEKLSANCKGTFAL